MLHFTTTLHPNGVLDVVLSREKKMNLMTPKFFEEARAIFDAASRDDNVRVVLVFANGKHFTAGLDLKESAQVF